MSISRFLVAASLVICLGLPLGVMLDAQPAKLRKPTATPVELIRAKKDFKVELLYSVPRETQGSWVSLCVDPKGRLITSDQYGKLYRITPSPLTPAPLPRGERGEGAATPLPRGARSEVAAKQTKVEELPVDLGEAQGLLWAFDSLYVVVNQGRKYSSGLWRVTSSKNDDVLDTKEKLRGIAGSGEHGPHAVVLGPDGKSLYVLCGNHTGLIKPYRSLAPPVWGEDFIVPRMWDPNGHAVGIHPPGGCIYKTDPDGKDWTIVSMGYRNPYDMAFNRDGELFTFDADMEWDFNTPWYRPTRVCHAVPGSEFGWRGGTGKFYEYYPDNLPPVYNVGPGSPTGMIFGYGAKFPAKYQEALFMCDWSYGKLYALHLTPQGSTYSGELEEFLIGTPLPMTDIVVNPIDGAMYFVIGGRSTMSGLYRITYTGKESVRMPVRVDQIPGYSSVSGLLIPPASKEQAIRRELESFYGKRDPRAVGVAWPYLKSDDRFLRFAARTALEWQDPKTWQEKALKETNPVALTHALIGLARVGDKALQPRILEALERVDWVRLTDSQKIDYLRTYQLVFIRMGQPSAQWKERVAKRLDARYPVSAKESVNRDLNAELCKLMCYLEPPDGVAKTLALLAKAPTQEEQLEYVLSLRTVQAGWSLKQRKEYFNWFHKAAGYHGGNSFHGFLKNIRNEAIKSLPDDVRAQLKDVLANEPTPSQPKFVFKKRTFVKKWAVSELLPIIEKGLTKRDFDRGHNLFGEAKCFACHRFANEGGGFGPDLSVVSGRFGARDLLEKMIEPSKKEISDQYASTMITLDDGRAIHGRIINLNGDSLSVNTDMLDPNNLLNINRKHIEKMETSKISMMPENLLDTFTKDEILDLTAYLFSRGDRNHKMFRK